MSPSVPPWMPNALSTLRIALVWAWLAAAEATRAGVLEETRGRLLAAGVLVAIGVSDVLDGWLARRFHLQSRSGAVLDAFADKLAQVVVLGWLALRGGGGFAALPLWFLALLVARDLVLGGGWLWLRLRNGSVRVVHDVHGKAASVLLFLLGLGMHAGADLAGLDVALLVLGGLVAMSTAMYVRDGWRQRLGIAAGPAVNPGSAPAPPPARTGRTPRQPDRGSRRTYPPPADGSAR